MEQNLSIESHAAHIWRALLIDLAPQEPHFLTLLSPDEVERANRFRFPKHRQRFIIARGVLREIASLYTQIPAKEIQFDYGPRGKPFLRNNPLNIQFNVSHSDDIAVYAFTKDIEIGVDVEKIENDFKDAIAQRFFSEQEYAELKQLPEEQHINGFYTLWASKEALIKAVGEGLYVPLGNFSIALNKKTQSVSLNHADKTTEFYLENFDIHPQYKSAFATNQDINKISYWEWLSTGPNIIRY